MRKSVFLSIIVHLLQLAVGSAENATLSCRLSRKSVHSGFHRCCFCV